MSIEYVEIMDASRTVIGIIDTAKSIIWHSKYNGVGDFEIYAQVTDLHLELLSVGNYVARNDNDEIGLIEEINIIRNAQDGQMISATGRFGKSLLDRRIIYNITGTSNRPAILNGNLENAIRKLITDNAINCTFDNKRNIDILELGNLENLPETLKNQKQVTCNNLLEYTDLVLEEYGVASKIVLNAETKKLQYVLFKGADRSFDNTSGNEPIIFSQEFDNFYESEYLYNTKDERNVAIIGGEGEGVDRFYALEGEQASGLNRREIWVDASSINKTFKDESDIEHTYTDAEYNTVLKEKGKEELSTHVKIESFNGSIDLTYSQWKINRDFFLGDIVTIQDNSINKYINARIVETTEVQDENGYKIEAVYK